MADSEKAPEPMETSTVGSAGAETGDSSKAANHGTDNGQEKTEKPQEKTVKSQEKTEKPQAKPAGKAAAAKKDSAGFSNVSASYSQLQSGLQDIVKSYVASKSSTTNKSSSASNAKAEEGNKQEDTNGKRKKANDDSDVRSGEEEHNFFDDFLDRTKSDFYCKVCDSHMNSEQMWENHVQGKRHLKNIKKEPGEPPSKVKAVKTDLIPKILRTLDQVREPVVGLGYMCELQRAESYLDPTYTCFLCHATCTVSSVVDHILGTKHRLAYLKAVNADEYSLVEEMKLKKSGLTSIAEDYAREFERKTGRGNMEVKIEKPKMAPPSSKRDRRYLEDDSEDDDLQFRRRHLSPSMELGWRRDRWSPPLTSVLSSQQMPSRLSTMISMMSSAPNYSSMPMMEKLNVLRLVSNNLVVVFESEGREVMQIINALTQSLLQYKIRVLPPQLQDTLARHIITGDAQALESTLGLRGSGVSNVGSVISSMAASGDLQMRNPHRAVSPPPLRMGPGSMGGPSNSSESGRNPWGAPGSGVARMPSPMRGGYNPTSYPPSQWPSGMGSGSFRGSDKSSFGY